MNDNNLSNIMKQAQAMQGKLKEAQERIEKLMITGIAGGGAVKIEMSGRHQVHKLTLDDSLFKDHNKALIEDLICAAFNDAVKRVEKASRDQMATLASGLNLPPSESHG